MNDPSVIQRLLTTPATWAVVGLSSSFLRDSYRIAKLLQGIGMRIVPVNPFVDEVHGEKAYARLADVPFEVDVVDLFRRVPGPHVYEAIEIGAGAVWMQLGVIDDIAAAAAEEAGLDVVMNRCPAIEYPRVAGY